VIKFVSNLGQVGGLISLVSSTNKTHPQVIKFTSCLLMFGGPLRVIQLPPPLKLVAMI
jgi:hypothetical protein